MKKYKAIWLWGYFKIEIVTAVKGTPHLVRAEDGTFQSADGCNQQYFDTWQEAKDHLTNVAKTRAKRASLELEKANEGLRGVESWEDPS